MSLVGVAQRIGGFAATTAGKWLTAALPDVPATVASPKRPRVAARMAKPAVALTTSAAVAAFSRNERLRKAVSDTLQKGARAIRSGTSSNGSNGLAEKTRTELYELAKEADVPGRSNMTKDELARALSD